MARRTSVDVSVVLVVPEVFVLDVAFVKAVVLVDEVELDVVVVVFVGMVCVVDVLVFEVVDVFDVVVTRHGASHVSGQNSGILTTGA